MPIQETFLPSPIGTLQINATDEYVTAVLFLKTPAQKIEPEAPVAITATTHPVLLECMRQLNEYFEGKRKFFNLPLQQNGTSFQQTVWSELQRIPFGRTISYAELSKRIGNVKAIRAVGTTNGKNALSIIVPCHRVIGSNGDLTGYAGELWRKKWLLDHEAKYAAGVQTLF